MVVAMVANVDRNSNGKGPPAAVAGSRSGDKVVGLLWGCNAVVAAEVKDVSNVEADVGKENAVDAAADTGAADEILSERNWLATDGVTCWEVVADEETAAEA